MPPILSACRRQAVRCQHCPGPLGELRACIRSLHVALPDAARASQPRKSATMSAIQGPHASLTSWPSCGRASRKRRAREAGAAASRLCASLHRLLDVRRSQRPAGARRTCVPRARRSLSGACAALAGLCLPRRICVEARRRELDGSQGRQAAHGTGERRSHAKVTLRRQSIGSAGLSRGAGRREGMEVGRTATSAPLVWLTLRLAVCAQRASPTPCSAFAPCPAVADGRMSMRW